MSPLFALLNFGSLAGLALLLWIFWIPAWQRRRAEAPLRTELRARPAVDFSTKVMSKALLLGSDLPMRDFLNLTVRGDAFEISHRKQSARVAFGREYCFRAADTTVTTARSQMQDWIVVQGLPASRNNRVWITNRGELAPIWDALVRAGAQPASPPPR
jgi:hypothetical protein